MTDNRDRRPDREYDEYRQLIAYLSHEQHHDLGRHLLSAVLAHPGRGTQWGIWPQRPFAVPRTGHNSQPLRDRLRISLLRGMNPKPSTFAVTDLGADVIDEYVEGEEEDTMDVIGPITDIMLDKFELLLHDLAQTRQEARTAGLVYDWSHVLALGSRYYSASVVRATQQRMEKMIHETMKWETVGVHGPVDYDILALYGQPWEK